MIETYISIAALLVVLVLGFAASRNGLFNSLARMVFSAFALLAACRYWYPFANWFGERMGFPLDRLSFVCFWIIFAVIYVPFQALIRTLNDEFVPVYPAPVERVGGFFSGAVQGFLLCAAVLLSILPQLPDRAPNLNLPRLLFPLDEVLTKSYRLMEEKSGIADPLSRTVLPLVTSQKENEPMKVSWQ